MSRTSKIVSDLRVLSLLSKDHTLSPSTMTIINHKSWSSSIWRTYSGEDRKQTITHIKGIFLEALSILQYEFSNDILDCLIPALKGFSSLKETYKDDYYTISEIDSIINQVKNSLDNILFNRQQSNENISVSNTSASNCSESVDDSNSDYVEDNRSNCFDHITSSVNEEHVAETTLACEDFINESILGMMNSTEDNYQKIYPRDNYETENVSGYTSCPEILVKTPDRTSSEETAANTIHCSDSINSTEASYCINNVYANDIEYNRDTIIDMDSSPNDTIVDIDEIYHFEKRDDLRESWDKETKNVNELVRQTSENIAKIIVNLSDQTTEFILDKKESSIDIQSTDDNDFIKKSQINKHESLPITTINRIYRSSDTFKKEEHTLGNSPSILPYSRKSNITSGKRRNTKRKCNYPDINIPDPNIQLSDPCESKSPESDTSSGAIFFVARAFKQWISSIDSEDSFENRTYTQKHNQRIKKN